MYTTPEKIFMLLIFKYHDDLLLIRDAEIYAWCHDGWDIGCYYICLAFNQFQENPLIDDRQSGGTKFFKHWEWPLHCSCDIITDLGSTNNFIIHVVVV